MSKHTPGPWEWMDCSLWGDETKAVHNGKTCIECGHSPAECGPAVLGLAVQHLCDDGENWDCNEADRRLIAAAPEMLQALHAIVTELMDGDHYNAEQIARHAGRAAIAKATGEA